MEVVPKKLLYPTKLLIIAILHQFLLQLQAQQWWQTQ
jgi:hypothetical protein